MPQLIDAGHSDEDITLSQFPPFHSPTPKPVAGVISRFDLAQNHSILRSYAQNSHLSNHSGPSTDQDVSPVSTPTTELVPPSLLSPAFTPPSTPGSSTPIPQKEPRSVPVNSADEVFGGVGARKPKLLEILPKVECVVAARIPMTSGTEMFLHLYTNNTDKKEHLAIVFGPHIRSRSLNAPRPGETEMDRMTRGAYEGKLYPGRSSSRLGQPSSSSASRTEVQQKDDLSIPPPPLVRIHSECYTGETAWSARCDCGEQLDEAARLMSLPSASRTGGVIIYLRQEGRGIGLSEKLKAYNLQDLGSDTVEANLLLRHPADARTYGLATAILVDLGLGGERGIRLLTNNPDKIRAVEGPNREVVVRERVAMIPIAWRTGGRKGVNGDDVSNYLRTKIEKMGHLLPREGER
ncbi:MAG: GTP cyclohydrolase II [Peltula sp. TS41687]|nr:MAG: GTP cyclohydrolase II [Peltula sp. TS41687]